MTKLQIIEMKNKNLAKAVLAFFTGLLLVSCSSKEDELVGKWGNSFGLKNKYTSDRVYTSPDNHDAFFQTFIFENGEKGEKGAFTDYISPVVIGDQNPDEMVIGSEISGTWEVKGDKLYLYFDNESFSLTNADMIGRTDRIMLEDEMAQKFLENYEYLGTKGLSYKIFHKNNKTGLEINFGNTKVTLIKKENRN